MFAVNTARLICAGGTGLEYRAFMLPNGRAIFPSAGKPAQDMDAGAPAAAFLATGPRGAQTRPPGQTRAGGRRRD